MSTSLGIPLPNYEALIQPGFEEEVAKWLRDDVPSFDIGGFVVGDKPTVGHLLCKSNGVLAGRNFPQTLPFS